MGNDLALCDKIGNKLSELGKWRVWQNVILGQFLALLLCAINTLSHIINSSALLVLPTGQSFPHYMLLFVIYTSWLAFRKGERGLISILKARGWRYILLCLIDVQANTLMNTAHQFTTLSSIQLLGCVAIPVALALSCLVLGVRYRMVHILAISVCLMGIGCLVWANTTDTKFTGKNQLVGDMLCLGGAVLFAIVTVLQELAVKKTDVVEFLGLLGLFGSIVSGLQMVILEKQELLTDSWKQYTNILTLFSISQFIFCILSCIFLQNMGTTALHLSLLSGNFYTLITGTVLLNYKCHALYFLSYLLTMVGVYIYVIKPTPFAAQYLPSDSQRIRNVSNRPECHIREHISLSPDHNGEMLSTFGTINSMDTLPITMSTNTTFTSFYGSHDVLNNKLSTSTA
ncbi:hypothetical protein RI129_000953 [Pyrocoelia pectoralis]|uniref:Solute carrier family 35 member F1 n=1 Tax=Pyrocoelia pectoralis TaxID=417401 RepID=A0AAN7VWN6_9COLE